MRQAAQCLPVGRVERFFGGGIVHRLGSALAVRRVRPGAAYYEPAPVPTPVIRSRVSSTDDAVAQRVSDDQEGSGNGGGQPERQNPGIYFSELFHTTSCKDRKVGVGAAPREGGGVERGG